MTDAPSSLQALMDSKADLVDYFYNDCASPHFSRAGVAKTAGLIPPVFTNWRDEQTAWAESAALFHQSHHMPELFLEGPDALTVLDRFGINTTTNFTEDRAKQFVACTADGHVVGDCIAYRIGPERYELVSGMPVLNWLQYHAETGGYDVQITRDNHSTANPTGRRVNFRFQIDGPLAGKVFDAAVDGEAPEIGFFRTARTTIAGVPVLVLHHGMAGNQGVEISGPFEHETKVRDAILAAGEQHGLLPVGTQAYFSTPLSNSWMAYPVPGIFSSDELRPYREWLPGDTWEAFTQLGGSYVSPEISDYYATPYDLGYGHMVKFDHDFVGREALQAIPEESRRRKVVLVWDHDDVTKIMASALGDGPRYKSLELPVSYYAWNQFDEVRGTDDAFAGVSCHTGYVNPDGELLSLAMLDAARAEPGAEVVLTWGEPDGGSRKPQVERHTQTTVRATVAKAPYSASVQRSIRADLQR